jgi:LysM repeat protein
MRLVLSVFFSLISFGVFASSARDSVGVENNGGKQLILHKVAPKESYYSIARIYNVLPKDVIAQNNNVSLQIGATIKVPTNRPFATAPATASASPGNSADLIEYTVGQGETLFAIARRFNTSVASIREVNDLKSASLSIGQKLRIRASQPAEIPATTKVAEQPLNTGTNQAEKPAEAVNNTGNPEIPENRPKVAMNRLGLTERSEKGVAVWIDDESFDKTKMLALHRTAPIGTVIRITNPMTDKTTYAKVVGKFTENETTKDVIIVMTKATADLLGALDKRFLVNIDYGMPPASND